MGDDGLASGTVAAGEKKAAWKKPSNGAIAVMGAETWPALAESARASYSLKANVSQDMVVGSLSLPKEVDISSPKLASNHVVSSSHKQESMKHNGSRSSHHMSPRHNLFEGPPKAVDTPLHITVKSSGLVGEPSIDGTTNKDGGHRGDSYGGNESQPQRSFKKNNSGPLARGDGSYQGNHGGRHDQEHGQQDSRHQSFGSRDKHGFQKRTGFRHFMSGPTSNEHFVPPPPIAVRPFVPPMVYTNMPSPVFYVSAPHPDTLRPISVVSMPSMFFPMHDPHLPSKIVNQIDYYFSNENLVKDTFLCRNMDGEGWVPIKLIASFKKVLQLTDNIQLILDAINASNVVEVQGDKVRRKNDWMKWIMSPLQTTAISSQSFSKFDQSMLAAHFNNVTLDEKAVT